MNELIRQSIKPNKAFINRSMNQFDITLLTKGGQEFKTTKRSTRGKKVTKTSWRSNTNFNKMNQTIYIKRIASNSKKIELQTYRFNKDIKIIQDVPTEVISHKLVNITILSAGEIFKKNTVQQSNMGYHLDFREDFQTIDKYLSKSELKYIQLDKITSHGHYQYEIFSQIERVYKFKARLEILQNFKSYRVMRSIVHGNTDMRMLTLKYIKINKQWLKRDLDMRNIEDLEIIKEYYPLNDENIERLKSNPGWGSRIDYTLSLERTLGIKPRKLLRYLDRQNKSNQYYEDYLRMMRSINMETTNWTKAFPKDLRVAHDQAMHKLKEIEEMNKTKELENLEKKYSSFKEMLKKIEFLDENYSVIVPDTINSIRKEGESLQHCVSTKRYLKGHANLESIILFIRKTQSIDEPYFTLELNQKGSIVQLHGFGNEDRTEKGKIAKKEKPAVEQFVKEVIKENDYLSNFINITSECKKINRGRLQL